MKNLAIECSGTAGSVGISDRAGLLGFVELDAKIGSIQTLAPQIERLIHQHGRPQVISITSGPGSFTGLRVGLSAAKMFGFAWRIPLVAVDSLEVIAARLSQGQTDDVLVVPIMNAFRGQVFTNVYHAKALTDDRSNHSLYRKGTPCCVDAKQWCDDPIRFIAEPTNSIVFTGPGLSLFQPNLAELRGRYPGISLSVAESWHWHPRAIEVGTLGWRAFDAGETWDAFSLPAAYIRASAAEEKASLAKR